MVEIILKPRLNSNGSPLMQKCKVGGRRVCFHCDENFTPGHHCKDRRLQVLLVNDNEDGYDESEYMSA